MLWHRQRPCSAYVSGPPPSNSNYSLRPAWCCKVKGFITKNLKKGLCHHCYKIALNRSEYKELYTHLLSDGHIPPVYDCTNCGLSLISQNLLSTCCLCTRTQLNFLTSRVDNNQDIDLLADPTIIHISGLQFDLQE